MKTKKKFADHTQSCIITAGYKQSIYESVNALRGLAVVAESELLQRKNLGIASVNILRAVGVNTFADLQELGSIETYCRIKERGINVSKVMLYALEGALIDVHWKDISPEHKARLVTQAEEQMALE